MASGTNIAKAYVQVVPTTKNIKNELKAQMSGGAKEAGEATGTAVGEGLVSKVKGLIAAAGIGKILQTALNAGGDLQQSFGGLDTIYEEAAGAAKEYAKEAAAAGISMNDYAEQAVSMGAALKNSLGGDSVKAAEQANKAIMDMADNSAKMGTDLESLQNAYVGFSRGNFTMLDNLSLGFAGTKEGMQQLLDKAKDISGIEYNIDSYSDIVDAIHVVQDEMNIMGVAADEASTTLSGSFGAMKAAGENFLAAITLGEGVEESLTTLVTSTGTFLFNNLLPMVGNIVKSIPGVVNTTITTFLPQIQQAGWNMLMELVKGINKDYSKLIFSAQSAVTGFINSVSQKLPNVLNTGKQVLLSIVNGILSNLPSLISSVGSIIITFTSAILSNMPTILTNGWQMLKQLMQGIISHLPDVADAVLSVISRFAYAVLTNLPKILDSGIKILTELLVGVVNAIPKIPGAISQVIAKIKEHFGETDWAELGRNLIQGLIDGIVNMAGSLYTAIKNVIKGALNSGKQEADVHSPSRKWNHELGQMLGLGMAEGIEESSKAVNAAVKDITSSSLDMGQIEVTKMASVTATGLTSSASNNGADLLYSLLAVASDINNTMESKMNNALGSGVGLNINGREFGRIIKAYA